MRRGRDFPGDTAPYRYEVTSPYGVPVMLTEHPELRYDAETELQMLSLGYKLTVNGKRVTKKDVNQRLETGETPKTAPARRKK